ncbi:MAG: NAD(P)/FAD-dependent oxidoreductase, partial [Thermoplasmata archaeon]|nr:NAD(P)/FAD-dependent oxidoreductase [Thermoplasmata archaeon]
AASLGASVLVLEKARTVGEPVRCGEFLPSMEEIRRISAETEGFEDLFDLPTRILGRFIERAVAYAPSGRTFEVDFQGHAIRRGRLDRYLARQASDEGAELWTGTPFLGFDDGDLVIPHARVRATVVIGADGPRSLVARERGFPEHELLFPALSLSLAGSFDPVFEAYFGGAAPGGYAWVIPRHQDANVGLGVRPDLRQDPLRAALDTFLEARGLVPHGDPTGGFVPMSGPLPETVRGNVLLAGDAAGHVLSTSGGGIFTAMMCGRLAGRAAAEYVTGRAPLTAYEAAWRRVLGGAFERAWALFRMLAPFFDDPEALEESFRVLGPTGLAAALRCQDLPAPEARRRESPPVTYPRTTKTSP